MPAEEPSYERSQDCLADCVANNWSVPVNGASYECPTAACQMRTPVPYGWERPRPVARSGCERFGHWAVACAAHKADEDAEALAKADIPAAELLEAPVQLETVEAPQMVVRAVAGLALS